MQQMDLLDVPRRRRSPGYSYNPKEFKVMALRDCPTPAEMQLCDTPDKVVAYWRAHIETDLRFNPEVECLVAFILNTRRRLKGHYLVSIGTLDTILVSPREVFKTAIAASAAAIVVAHNHPSGDATPSDADIRVTRDLIRAGQLLKIELLDHVIVGQPLPERTKGYSSLRELGYFAG